MPPAPRGATISYGPRRVPVVSCICAGKSLQPPTAVCADLRVFEAERHAGGRDQRRAVVVVPRDRTPEAAVHRDIRTKRVGKAAAHVRAHLVESECGAEIVMMDGVRVAQRSGGPRLLRQFELERAGTEYGAAGKVAAASHHAPARAAPLDTGGQRPPRAAAAIRRSDAQYLHHRDQSKPRAVRPGRAQLDFRIQIDVAKTASNWSTELIGVVVGHGHPDLQPAIHGKAAVDRREIDLAIDRRLPQAEPDADESAARIHHARVIEPRSEVPHAGSRNRCLQSTHRFCRARGGHGALVVSVRVAVAVPLRRRRRAHGQQAEYGGGARQTLHQSPPCFRGTAFDLPDFVFVVVVSVERINASASLSARRTTVVSAFGRRSWIAWPRLMPSVTIRVFRSANEIPRLFDTFTAATN